MKKIILLILSFIVIVANAIDYKPDQVSFYNVPMVCSAVPTIGCGSRSKPLLAELEAHPQIKEAWLNRGGTVIAVVWEQSAADTKSRKNALNPFFKRYNLSLNEVRETSIRSTQLETFGQIGKWYKGGNVDELSLEEAGTIADNAISVFLDAKIITEEQAKSIDTEIEAWLKTEMENVRNQKHTNTTDIMGDFRNVATEIIEKYVGKGNVPEISMRNGKVELVKND